MISILIQSFFYILIDCQGRGMSYASVVKNEKQPVDFDDAFVQELMER